MRWSVLVVLAACGTAHVHRVEIRGMQFVPAKLAVHVGDTVVWTNVDVVPHTVTSSTFDSKNLESKQQWRYKVTAPGEYPYECTYHPTMEATLIAK